LVEITARIRAKLKASNEIDLASVEDDIRARRAEADAGLEWAAARDAIQADCQSRKITEEQWCQTKLGCHIATMRRRVQLARNWEVYIVKRRQEEASVGQWGLLYALSLIPARDRYATNAQAMRTRSATGSSMAADGGLDLSRCEFITDDALVALRRMATNSVQTIITSPPFWPLRRSFGGKGLGFELTFAEYLAKLVAIVAECKRVLKPNGTLWMELEDAYSHGGGQWRPDTNITSRSKKITHLQRMPNTTSLRSAKSLMMIPALIALAMMDDGWLLRQHLVWDKGFARPDSAKDRATKTFSEILMFAKSARYQYDSDPLREPSDPGRLSSLPGRQKRGLIRRDANRDIRVWNNPLGRNAGTVWRVNLATYRGDHTATMPTKLVAKMVLASCTHEDDIVLDPFGGAGTVAMVALQLGFRAISIDIHKPYTDEARQRLSTAPANFDFGGDDEEDELANAAD
jgi:DNA modification methylase